MINFKDYKGGILNNDFISVETDDERKKVVHFHGFYYLSEPDEDGLPYRFVAYTFFYLPLDGITIEKYNDEAEEIKQYISNLSEKVVDEEVSSFFFGNPPQKVITWDELTEDLPEGNYLLIHPNAVDKGGNSEEKENNPVQTTSAAKSLEGEVAVITCRGAAVMVSDTEHLQENIEKLKYTYLFNDKEFAKYCKVRMMNINELY